MFRTEIDETGQFDYRRRELRLRIGDAEVYMRVEPDQMNLERMVFNARLFLEIEGRRVLETTIGEYLAAKYYPALLARVQELEARLNENA